MSLVVDRAATSVKANDKEVFRRDPLATAKLIAFDGGELSTH